MPETEPNVPIVTQVEPVAPETIVPVPVATIPEVKRKPEPRPLTPVKEKAPERINAEINKELTIPPQNVNFPVNFSPTKPLKKLPKKMGMFKGKPGRQRTNEQVRELLEYYQLRGVWLHGISDQMQRYYKREYPEYFRKGRKGKKVQANRSTPIDLSTRRTGTNV